MSALCCSRKEAKSMRERVTNNRDIGSKQTAQRPTWMIFFNPSPDRQASASINVRRTCVPDTRTNPPDKPSLFSLYVLAEAHFDRFLRSISLDYSSFLFSFSFSRSLVLLQFQRVPLLSGTIYLWGKPGKVFLLFLSALSWRKTGPEFRKLRVALRSYPNCFANRSSCEHFNLASSYLSSAEQFPLLPPLLLPDG